LSILEKNETRPSVVVDPNKPNLFHKPNRAVLVSIASVALLPLILGFAFIQLDIVNGGSLRPVVFEISWLFLAFLIISTSIGTGAPVIREAKFLPPTYLAVFLLFACIEFHTVVFVAPSAKMASYFLGIAFTAILLGLAAAALRRRIGDTFIAFVAWALFLAMLLHAPSWLWLYSLESQNPDFDWRSQLPGYPGLRMYGYSVEAGIAAGLGLFFLSEGQEKKRRMWLTIGVTVLWMLLFWGGGRGAYFSLFATIILVCLVVPKFARKMWLFCIATVSCGAGLSLLLPNPGGSYGFKRGVERTLNSSSLNEISTERVTVWVDAYGIFLERPFFGHGAAQYPRLTQYPELAVLEQTHNILLESLVSFGVIGTVALIYLLGKIWLTALLSLRDVRSAATIPMVLVATTLLTHGFFSGTFFHIHSMFIIALSLGVLLLSINAEQPTS